MQIYINKPLIRFSVTSVLLKDVLDVVFALFRLLIVAANSLNKSECPLFVLFIVFVLLPIPVSPEELDVLLTSKK